MNITDIKSYSKWLKGKIDFSKHSYAVLSLLQDIAQDIGKPLTITSSFRTPQQNVQCGGSPTSSHLKGLAFDVKCTTSTERYQLLTTLILFGVKRIGIYKNFIHFDVDPTKPQSVIWYG